MLWTARNRAFVVEQPEKALQDPTQDLPGASTLLQTAVALRARLDASADPNHTAESLRTDELAARNEVSSPEFAAAGEVVIISQE